MSLPVYLLISGNALHLGLVLLAGGVLVARWQCGVGRVIVAVGLVLALVSAVPLHPATYGLLFVATAAWLFITKLGTAVIILAMVAWAALENVIAGRLAGTPLSPKQPVVVLGDSISAGLGVLGERTWPQLLAVELGLRVTNLSRPGAKLTSGATQAHAIPPDIGTVLVELGGNDLLAGTSPAQFETDLRGLLTTLVAPDRRILMFELPLLPFQNAYGRIQRETCKQHGVNLVPRSHLAGAIALPGHAIDGLHLSARGHAWLAERPRELWTAVRR